MEILVEKVGNIRLTVDIRCATEIFHKYPQSDNRSNVENMISLFTTIN